MVNLAQNVGQRLDLKVVFEIPEELLDILQQMEDRAGDLTPAMIDVSRLFEKRALDNFASKSSSAGPWKPHADSTEERWGDHPLLDLPPSGFGLIDTIDRTAGPDFAAAFSTAPHAHLQQYGTEVNGKAHAPAREIFELTDELVDEAVRTIEDFVTLEDENE